MIDLITNSSPNGSTYNEANMQSTNKHNIHKELSTKNTQEIQAKQESNKKQQAQENIENIDKQKTIKSLNKALSVITKDIQFSFDPDTDILGVLVVEHQTGKIINKFPLDDIGSVMSNIKSAKGILMNALA